MAAPSVFGAPSVKASPVPTNDEDDGLMEGGNVGEEKGPDNAPAQSSPFWRHLAILLCILLVGVTAFVAGTMTTATSATKASKEDTMASEERFKANEDRIGAAIAAIAELNERVSAATTATSAAGQKSQEISAAGQQSQKILATEGGARVYDKLYGTGYHKDLQLSHEKPVVDLAVKFLPPTGVCPPGQWCSSAKRVLVIGCSHGKGVASLHKAGYDASGMDVATKAIETALRVRGNAVCSTPPCFRQAALGMRLPWDDGAFDVGVSSDVLEHVPEKDVPEGAREITRIVKNFLILRIANFKEMGKNGERLGMGNLHVTVHGSQWWYTQFEKYGWKLLCDLTGRSNYVFVVLGRQQDAANKDAACRDILSWSARHGR